MKKTLTVALSGLNVIDSPGPGIAVLRSLKESTRYNFRFIGLAYENLEPGIYMGYTEKSYQIPYPTAGTGTLLQRIAYIHEREKIDLIIPNFDAELQNFIRIAPQLSEMGIRTFLPDEDCLAERDKNVLSEYGEKHSVRVPESRFVTGLKELEEVCRELEFPVFVKGRFYEAYKAYSIDQAIALYHKISAKWGLPIIVQKYIAGEEFNTCALGDGNGNLIGSVSMKKLYITDAGKAWAGISIFDEGLHAMAEQIMKSTCWRGGMEIEMIKPADEDPYVIEINPRFPAWVYLAPQCGMNLPERLVSMATGDEPDTSQEYTTGRVFIRYSQDMVIDLDGFHKFNNNGEL